MGMPLFHRDKMTSEERTLALLMGAQVDRVPFILLALGFQGVNVGYTIYEWYTDMQKAFNSGKWTHEQYGAMWMPFAGYPGIGPWEFGGEMKWPLSASAQCPNVEPAISSEDQAWSLKMPDFQKLVDTGYVPYFREFARIATSQGLPYLLAIYCPWTTAGNIVGVERLCRWVIKKPDLAHHCVRLATDFLIAFNKIIVDEFGAKGYIPVVSMASASNNLISPKSFKEFVLPYLREYFEKLIDMRIEGIFLHLCGEQNANYPFYKELPLPPLSLISVSHEVDLEKASATFPDFIIAGNINTVVLQLGTPEQVYEACRTAIEKGKKHKRGFILSPGCEMPPRTPPYNVWMMAKAINDFGYYT
ncbi:MAG: uroporphyrinogen decarboxylase family protein [Nitrospirota bacterium]